MTGERNNLSVESGKDVRDKRHGGAVLTLLAVTLTGCASTVDHVSHMPTAADKVKRAACVLYEDPDNNKTPKTLAGASLPKSYATGKVGVRFAVLGMGLSDGPQNVVGTVVKAADGSYTVDIDPASALPDFDHLARVAPGGIDTDALIIGFNGFDAYGNSLNYGVPTGCITEHAGGGDTIKLPYWP